MISDVFHHAIFQPIALAYFSIFSLENLAENCLNVAFHDDNLQIYVFFTISRKKILEKTMKNTIPPLNNLQYYKNEKQKITIAQNKPP